MKRFTIPRDVYFGENAIDCLKTLNGKKAFIVIDSDRVIQDGTMAKIEANLKEAKIETHIFCGVEPDPSIDTVRKGVAEMTSFGPDVIIAIGGGSPIDAAKAMWIFYEYPDFTFEEAAKPFNLPQLRTKAKFVAISTTSGTGTEVTAFSVITDKKNNIKYPIADYNITPDIAVVDTNLVNTLPKVLVAYTGMDALIHSFEAYVSTFADPITDSLAIKSIQMIFNDLENSYNGDLRARGEIHIAQCMAGMSFTNAILGIVHSMAHNTGAIFHVPHGCANSIYFPYVIKYNAKDARATQRYADIARAVGLQAGSDAELVKALIEKVQKLIKTLSIPSTLKEFGIKEDEFLKYLPQMAKGAVADPCTGTNPRSIDVDTMTKLITAAYHGEDVQF